MAGGQLAPVTLFAGNVNHGGALQPALLSAAGSNTQGLQLANDTLFAQGTTGLPSRLGVLATALDPATYVGRGSAAATGTAAITLEAVGHFAAGAPNDVYLTAAGTVSQSFNGLILAPVSFVGNGHLEPNPALAQTLADATVAMVGTNVNHGYFTPTLDALTVVGIGNTSGAFIPQFTLAKGAGSNGYKPKRLEYKGRIYDAPTKRHYDDLIAQFKKAEAPKPKPKLKKPKPVVKPADTPISKPLTTELTPNFVPAPPVMHPAIIARMIAMQRQGEDADVAAVMRKEQQEEEDLNVLMGSL